MRYPLMLPVLAVSLMAAIAPCQGNGTGVIQGTAYDLNGAVIRNIAISVENTNTGAAINLRTDETGQYRAEVQVGTYRVIMRPSVGYPIGYEHSSFMIAPGQKVTINFRPKPFSISSSISGGRGKEEYGGALPSAATHFIRQSDGAIRDLQIEYYHLAINSNVIKYTDSVIASFDKFTIYADRITFFPESRRLLAEGNVIFEDGETAHKTTRTDLNLLSTP